MFEKIKNAIVSVLSKEEVQVSLQAQPIEVASTENKLTNRKAARLARLQTVKNPSKEVKEEIASLKEQLKGK